MKSIDKYRGCLIGGAAGDAQRAGIGVHVTADGRYADEPIYGERAAVCGGACNDGKLCGLH